MTYRAVGWVGFSDDTQFDYPDVGDGKPYDDFKQWSWSPDEVYVFRFQAFGLKSPVSSFSQIYPFIRAYVSSMPMGNRNQEILGAAVAPSGSGNAHTIEILFADAGGYHTNADRAGDTLSKMAAALSVEGVSVSLQKGAPNEICCPAYLQLKDGTAIQKWLGVAPLWSASRFDAAGGTNLGTGYTEAAQDGRGVFLGTAKSTKGELAPKKLSPVLPPEPSGSKPDGATPASAVPGTGARGVPGGRIDSGYSEPTNWAPIVAIGAVAVAGIALVMMGQKQASRV